MATIDEMRQTATQIENETQVGGNTASRVGGLFNNVVDKLEEQGNGIAALQTTIDGNSTTIKMCRNTAAGFTSANPVLASGELGFETDRRRYKMGDGVTAWNNLAYRSEELDTTPTPNSTNGVESGGVYANIHSLGEKCTLPSQTETTQEAEVGQWQPTTGAIAATASTRGHMKILAKNNTAIKVVIPSNWYGAFYYVNDANVSQQDITQGWRNGTVELTLNGIYDLMVNIKYGSAGTTTINQSLVSGVNWGITHYFGGSYKPAAPYDDFVELQNNVESNNEDIEIINDTLFSDGEEKVINNSNADSSNYKSYTANNVTRGYLSVPADAMNDYSVSIFVKENSPIKCALQGWAIKGNYNSYVYDSSWILPNNSLTYSKNNPSIVELALVSTYVSGNTGIPTWSEFLQYIEFSVTYTDANGLVRRVEVLEEEQTKKIGGIDFSEQLETSTYYGEKIKLEQNAYTFSQIGTLQSGVSSRQGGAVYGNYLFQFHNTLATICVFDLSAGQNVDKITMTAIADCHAGSGGFSRVFYDNSDPFPLLYISSMDERKVYVFRLTGVIGSLSITLIQTITLSTPYFITNIAVDNENERLVIFGYTKNSWSDGSGNNSVIMSCDIPSYSGDVTITEFDNECLLPFIFAEQGAFASFGKLYLAYGNAGSPYYNGGVLVYDYLNCAIQNLIGVKAIGNIEPEACCQWGDKMILTTQDGKVYALEF